MRFLCHPKKPKNFCQRKRRQRCFFYQGEKWKERNKSCNSIWLEAKALFWSLLKIFLVCFGTLTRSTSSLTHAGRKTAEREKSFVTHRWFKISLIELSRFVGGDALVCSAEKKLLHRKCSLFPPSQMCQWKLLQNQSLQWRKDTLLLSFWTPLPNFTLCNPKCSSF